MKIQSTQLSKTSEKNLLPLPGMVGRRGGFCETGVVQRGARSPPSTRATHLAAEFSWTSTVISVTPSPYVQRELRAKSHPRVLHPTLHGKRPTPKSAMSYGRRIVKTEPDETMPPVRGRLQLDLRKVSSASGRCRTLAQSSVRCPASLPYHSPNW